MRPFLGRKFKKEINISIVFYPNFYIYTTLYFKNTYIPAVHPSRHELQLQFCFPFIMLTLVTAQVTGISVKSWIIVEIAGSSTKGTKNRKANTETIHRVPKINEV